MRVMQLVRGSGSGTGEVAVEAGDMPQPQPGAGQVLVRVRAAGVTPTERGWAPTWQTADGRPRPRPVPCHEFAGEIAELGAAVRGFAVGQAVFGMNDWYSDGALAEFCVAEAKDLALKPERLSFAEAAVTPISALTAMQGLFEHLQIQTGERLLVQGGAGAVGTFVVPLAKRAGAQVTVTASGADTEFVRALGADAVVDYRRERFEDAVRPVDAVFDLVGGETLRRSWAVLKPGGRLISIVSEGAQDPRDRAAFVLVRRDGEGLRALAREIDGGELRVWVKAVLPWTQAAEAFAGGYAAAPGAHGKVAVTVEA